MANIKPRIRMTLLYAHANAMNGLVVGTGNKSEYLVGYFTKWGDGAADIYPIIGLYKTEVKQLSKMLNLPKEIIEAKPSAGLWPGQTDEGEMGISYDKLDSILMLLENNRRKEAVEKYGEKLVKKVEEMVEKSEHKRRINMLNF